ncbi:hypothetical protein [Legionella fallonii]|nr:hypothetical protein [Legionella fallonii]
MRRSLSDLICDDLAELAHYGSDVIASEEALRCMVALYQNQGRLHNVHIVHKNELQSFLKSTLDVDTLKNSQGHYQFLIEVGSRSKAHQRSPETIHYCTVDLYFEPGKKPLAFIADQYRGYSGYYSEFIKIADELGIHFVIPGGDVFQADSVHCPVFSIHHLLLTASDTAISGLLDNIAGDTTDKTHTLFSWNELPPQYIYPSQSVSMLLKYVDYVKNKEALPEKQASLILENSRFATFLPANLYPDFKVENKIRNKSVKTLAAQMSGEVVFALENTSDFDENTLIDICYQDKYPVVHSLLTKALTISKKFPLYKNGLFQAHPLFELAFSFASPMEICFENMNFKDVFSNKAVLELMQKGLVDPRNLFNAMVSVPKEITVNKAVCNIVKSNLPGIEIIASCLDAHPEANLQNINALFMSRHCGIFFNNPILSKLFVNGLLRIEHVDKILAYQIDQKKFAAFTSDAERLEYLDTKFSLGLNLNVELGGSESVFSVPTIDIDNTEEVIPVRKPTVNIGLLVESMSKSIFTAENKTSEDIVPTPQQEIPIN